MAQLREVVAALGHAEVSTYIQSGNVLFTPRQADVAAARNAKSGQGGTSDAELAAGLERAIADGMGVQARVVVLSREELAQAVHDNPYPGEANPKLVHAVFLPGTAAAELVAWVAGALEQARAKGGRDEARIVGRTVYLHTPDGYGRSELAMLFTKAGGPTSARVAGTARNWATVTKLLELCGG